MFSSKYKLLPSDSHSRSWQRWQVQGRSLSVHPLVNGVLWLRQTVDLDEVHESHCQAGERYRSPRTWCKNKNNFITWSQTVWKRFSSVAERFQLDWKWIAGTKFDGFMLR